MAEASQKPRELQKALGMRIQSLREQKGWSSQRSFAATCVIDRTYLGQVERGEVDACLTILVKICKKLDVTVADLFEGLA